MSVLMNTYSRFNISFVKGDGSWLWDEKGNKYLDFSSGISVTNLGHANKKISEVISSQANKLIHTSNLYYIKEQEELASKIIENSFQGKVFFCNSGAEANEAAIKLSRLYGNKKYNGNRYKIISMYNSFHGRTYATLSATGQSKVHKGFTPTTGYNIYIPYNDIKSFQDAISFDDVVAVILEIFQGEGGVIPADVNYLKELREICKNKDILLIFDEIQTGYGRTGYMFGYQKVNIIPDIMTLAKGIGNGFPMGAVVAKDNISEYFNSGTHGSTFGGNQLGSSIGLKVIEEMTTAGFLDEVKKKGKILKELIKITLKDKVCIRGTGLLIGVETKFEPKLVVEECLKFGLVIIPAGNNSVRLYPPLNISIEDLKSGISIFIDVINQLEEKI